MHSYEDAKGIKLSNMSDQDIPFKTVLSSIEHATDLIPGALELDELASFVGNEQYASYAYAEISLRDLITIIWESTKD